MLFPSLVAGPIARGAITGLLLFIPNIRLGLSQFESALEINPLSA